MEQMMEKLRLVGESVGDGERSGSYVGEESLSQVASKIFADPRSHA
jgi:hypothetical protein